MTEIDILRAANMLLEMHGRSALLYSGGCHVQFYEKGDHVAARTWLRIDNAIVDMLYPEYVIRDKTAAMH